MRRRDFVSLACGLAAWPIGARAQRGRMRRIGLLGPTSPAASRIDEGLRAGLAEHGFVEGENLAVEARWAHGRFERLPGLAAELVALDVEVLVAVVTAASLAAQAATRTVPIVMVGVADPVEVGLVASLARPGGNVTGTSTLQADLVGKQLELARAADPSLAAVGVLWNPANAAFQALQVKQAAAEARAAGLPLRLVEASAPDDFAVAFEALRADRTRAVVVLGDPTFTQHRRRLVDLANAAGLLTVCATRDYAEAGCLLSYGPSYREASRRAAAYVARILAGARPMDLPVERSTRFEVIVNLQTARALGIDLPATLLARADEVIE